MIITSDRYLINTPDGFKPFKGIRKLNKDEYFHVELTNGITLRCSITHPFICNKKTLTADKLNVGDLIDSDLGIVKVKNIRKFSGKIDLYDIIGVDGGNIFTVDGIVSHNCDFSTTGNTIVDVETLKWIKENFIKDPIEKRWMNNDLWIWERANYTRDYLVCADVARGDGEDYSAFHVLDMESMNQVAEFKGTVDTKTYGNLLVSISNEYNSAILVIENNNVGWATIQQVIDLGYPNTFYSTSDLQYVDLERQMTGNINRLEKKMIPGFTTTTKTRPLIISKLESYFREKSITTNSVRLFEELSVFVWNGSKAEAMKGYNDDLVTSLGIGLWVRDTALRLRGESNEFNKTLIGGISKTGGDIIYSPTKEKAYESWSMPSNTFDKNYSQRTDITWLL